MDKKYDPRRLADREEKSNVTLRWWGPIVQRREGGRAGGEVGGGGARGLNFRILNSKRPLIFPTSCLASTSGVIECAYDL